MSGSKLHDVFHFTTHAKQTARTVLFESIVVQMTLGVSMRLLVALQFIKESLPMYKATKRLQLNRYMNLLAREGTIYFAA